MIQKHVPRWIDSIVWSPKSKPRKNKRRRWPELVPELGSQRQNDRDRETEERFNRLLGPGKDSKEGDIDSRLAALKAKQLPAKSGQLGALLPLAARHHRKLQTALAFQIQVSGQRQRRCTHL